MTQPRQIQAFATAYPLSPDTFFTILLLKMFGESFFPGVKEAPIIFWYTPRSPDGRTAAQLEAAGIFPVNCGGDDATFDHHSQKDIGQCAFTKALRELGRDQDPVFKLLATYVLADDTRATDLSLDDFFLRAAMPFHLGRMVKDAQVPVPFTGNAETDQLNREEALQGPMAWISYAFKQAYLACQQRFFDEGPVAVSQAVCEKVTDPDGRVWRLMTCQTDSDMYSKYARSAYSSFNPDVTIQKRSNGQVQIQTSNHRGLLDMRPLARRLRYDEACCRGLRSVVTSAAELEKSGTLDTIPWWHLVQAMTLDATCMLLNGSPRYPNVEATTLTLPYIAKLAKWWLSQGPWRLSGRAKTEDEDLYETIVMSLFLAGNLGMCA